MMKLGLFLNYDPHYRESIYTKIDSRWDCVWQFADVQSDVKHIGLDKFKTARAVKYWKLPFGLTYQSGWSRLLFDTNIDVIIFTGELFNISNWLLLLLRYIVAPKKKIFSWTHGWYGRESKSKVYIKRVANKLVTGDFVYSNIAKTIAINNGCDKTKLHVIHNSLNYDIQKGLRDNDLYSSIYKEHFGNQYPTIIFIGRLADSKRLDMILSAMHKLKQKGVLLNAVFVGGGDDKALRLLGDSLGLTENTWFVGPSYNEVTNAKLLFNADICVSPGNVGLTAIHALMFGTPVITHSDFSNQGPEVEAIKSGVTGAFFVKNDVTDLARVVENWIQGAMDRESIRRACYCEIDTYWTPSFQIEVLERVLE